MARRSAAQREKDLERTAELYLRGVYQSVIAAELGVTQGTVSNDLKALYKRWQASALVDIDEAKSRELARIDELERTYWTEWEASKQDRTATTTKAVMLGESEDTKRKEATVRKEQHLGDPRYLAGVQWCINKRAEIIGLNAPTKVGGVGKDGAIKQEIMLDLSGLTIEQIKEFAAWDSNETREK